MRIGTLAPFLLLITVTSAHARGYVSCRDDSCLGNFAGVCMILAMLVLLLKAGEVRVQRMGRPYRLTIGFSIAAACLAAATFVGAMYAFYAVTSDFRMIPLWARLAIALSLAAGGMWLFVTRYR